MARCVIADDDHWHDGGRCELTERHVYKWHGSARVISAALLPEDHLFRA
jgi:hypothetical protein